MSGSHGAFLPVGAAGTTRRTFDMCRWWPFYLLTYRKADKGAMGQIPYLRGSGIPVFVCEELLTSPVGRLRLSEVGDALAERIAGQFDGIAQAEFGHDVLAVRPHRFFAQVQFGGDFLA